MFKSILNTWKGQNLINENSFCSVTIVVSIAVGPKVNVFSGPSCFTIEAMASGA